MRLPHSKPGRGRILLLHEDRVQPCVAANPAWRRGWQSLRPVRRVAELGSLTARRMTPTAFILAFSTSNYNSMIKFFRDFGFTVVEDPHDQLTPFFEHGRAARVSWREFEFQ